MNKRKLSHFQITLKFRDVESAEEKVGEAESSLSYFELFLGEHLRADNRIDVNADIKKKTHRATRIVIDEVDDSTDKSSKTFYVSYVGKVYVADIDGFKFHNDSRKYRYKTNDIDSNIGQHSRKITLKIGSRHSFQNLGYPTHARYYANPPFRPSSYNLIAFPN